ncbi:hypothetical protein BBOV_III011680 [Babesia bovis T2Bo]|uniref:Uncharacterized protein n=1 Tax=Babesia bovis TaxID=5865 RepID=A7AQ86_BABBO|nr:hypothetical protein BBOV_III011680 [Babesia bovis T2Bo]EDO08720.1 hypothetical protein BBOV_III011680 [Babesia bovis T2Bo]|eukprot:XP_001612288.1 hypothetical protein [Babesia bovis T2Bo]
MCSCFLRFSQTVRRYYRIYPGRKRVQIETKIKNPNRYDELRGGNPATLLQGNMFTPESAAPRELSMLCFRIVGMGYADSHVLLRYANCTLNLLKQMRIKHIALVLQGISKFLATNSSVIGKSDGTDNSSFEEDISNREKLLLKVGEIMDALEPRMYNLFVRAMPKDLGMIALSMVTVCECAYRELDATQHSYLVSITERTLKLVAEALGSRLCFCEIQEYACLAKAYAKLPPHHEFVELFLRDLAEEISCLFSEKQDYLEELIKGNYFDDDALDSILSLPKDMTTIACSLSRRVTHSRMWERIGKCVKLMLEMDGNNDGSFGGLDGQTLMLLATSLSRHIDVSFLLEAMMLRPDDNKKPLWIVTGISIAILSLHNVELAQRLWNALDFDKLSSLDDDVKVHLVHLSNRIPKVTDTQIEVIHSFADTASSPDLLVALYASRHRCGLTSPQVYLDSVISDIDSLSVKSLLCLLRTLGHGATPNLPDRHRSDACLDTTVRDRVLDSLSTRVDEIRLDRVIPLLVYIVDHHGGRTQLIEKLAYRISNNVASLPEHQVALVIEKLGQIGIRAEQIFDVTYVRRLKEKHRSAYLDDDSEFEVGASENTPEDVHFCDVDDAEVDKLSQAYKTQPLHGNAFL